MLTYLLHLFEQYSVTFCTRESSIIVRLATVIICRFLSDVPEFSVLLVCVGKKQLLRQHR